MIRHAARIAIVVVGVAIYAPILLLATLQIVGPHAVQNVIDLFTQGCGARCSNPPYWIDIGAVAVFAITLPFLGWVGILWIRRAKRGDDRVEEIEDYFAVAPDRVSPAAIDEDIADRKFYRDRQGRLRPLEHYDAPDAD